jgi:hypothetical protein
MLWNVVITGDVYTRVSWRDCAPDNNTRSKPCSIVGPLRFRREAASSPQHFCIDPEEPTHRRCPYHCPCHGRSWKWSQRGENSTWGYDKGFNRWWLTLVVPSSYLNPGLLLNLAWDIVAALNTGGWARLALSKDIECLEGYRRRERSRQGYFM